MPKTKTERRAIQLSPWQRKVAGLVQSVDTLNTLGLAGGRGGGKSIMLLWILVYYALLYGENFNGVLIRADLAGLSKLEQLLYDQLPVMLPGSKYYKAKRRWRFSNGGTLGLIHMDGNDGFAKIQGEDLSWVGWDEITQEPDPQVVLRVRSSMRSTDVSCPPKFIFTGNPLGPGSWWLRDFLISKSPYWRIFNADFFGGAECCVIKSTLFDNPYLADPQAYAKELEASCFGDKAKIQAEVHGEWGIVQGGFWGSALSQERSMIDADYRPQHWPDPDGVWRHEGKARHIWAGGDWGTSSPACLSLAEYVPEDFEYRGRLIRRGSWIVFGEYYECARQNDGSKIYNKGNRDLTAPEFVRKTAQLYGEFGFVLRDIPKRRTIMDAAVGAQLGYASSEFSGPVTLATEFRKYGLEVTGSPKGLRSTGWQLMKSLMYHAGTDEPGLYISERCDGFWQTAPYCLADDKKGGLDMMIDAPDHSSDSIRYLLMAANQGKHSYQTRTGHPEEFGILTR